MVINGWIHFHISGIFLNNNDLYNHFVYISRYFSFFNVIRISKVPGPFYQDREMLNGTARTAVKGVCEKFQFQGVHWVTL